MRFVRIGDRIISVAAIAWVELSGKFGRGLIHLRNGMRVGFDAQESSYLAALLTAKRADRCPDCRGQLEQDVITYCPRCQGMREEARSA